MFLGMILENWWGAKSTNSCQNPSLRFMISLSAGSFKKEKALSLKEAMRCQ